MSVRSVLNNFNKGFLICGIGSIKFNQGNFKTTLMFYVLRCLIIYAGLESFYKMNLWAMSTDPEMSEITSIIMICSFELIFAGKFVSHIWRFFFDYQLSIVLTKLETIHEKLIRLGVVGPIKIKMNWIFIIGIIINITEIIVPTLWMISLNQYFVIQDMIIITVLHTCQVAVFSEYILLILYIQWLVYKINEQIPERRSCISSFRDMYLEVVECLNDANKSIYGLMGIVVFIASNIAGIMNLIYSHLLFPREYDNFLVFPLVVLLFCSANVLTLYMIGQATEKEICLVNYLLSNILISTLSNDVTSMNKKRRINRMSLVLHKRSVIEKNPRIKRQIKFFLLRRLHEHFHFQLYGMCHINLRHLLILTNSAIGYLVIQILFKLNK